MRRSGRVQKLRRETERGSMECVRWRFLCMEDTVLYASKTTLSELVMLSFHLGSGPSYSNSNESLAVVLFSWRSTP